MSAILAFVGELVGRPRTATNRVEFAHDPQARKRGVGDQRQALAREDAKAPAIRESLGQDFLLSNQAKRILLISRAVRRA
jgi:hypothetical protein